MRLIELLRQQVWGYSSCIDISKVFYSFARWYSSQNLVLWNFRSGTLFLLYINDLPDDVICNIAIYADDTTLYSKCDQASDLGQQLESASELKSNLQDIVDWGRNWLVDFSAEKTQLVFIDWSNNTDAIDVKMEWSVLEKKSSDAGVDFLF